MSNNNTTNEEDINKLYKVNQIFSIIATLICIGLVIFNFTHKIVIVNGDSMYPSYHNGNILITQRNTDPIDRFDTVIVNSTAAGKVLIKRVIGLPGDTVEYRDNKLYINNQYVDDKYNYGHMEDFIVTVKNDEYFCLGDNRDYSADSRYYGNFTADEIIGIVDDQLRSM